MADSESSCVRAVSTSNGSAKAVVGGALDPTVGYIIGNSRVSHACHMLSRFVMSSKYPQDLFAFGDVDGKGREVRLQHPMGVAWARANGSVYVADSYNHKVCLAVCLLVCMYVCQSVCRSTDSVFLRIPQPKYHSCLICMFLFFKTLMI